MDHIEKAYDYASRKLLDLLMSEKKLMARLRFVYFDLSFSADCVTVIILSVQMTEFPTESATKNLKDDP